MPPGGPPLTPAQTALVGAGFMQMETEAWLGIWKIGQEIRMSKLRTFMDTINKWVNTASAIASSFEQTATKMLGRSIQTSKAFNDAMSNLSA